MKQPVPLKNDNYYHIYNRGINGENLFRENSNYEHFHFKHRRVFQTPTGLKETGESNPSVCAAPDGVLKVKELTMKQPVPLQYDNYYHIYNRGINSENLFRENSNYEHFLRLYSEHIEPVAETFAWVLLRNHFHLLVRILPEQEIDFIKPREDKKHIVYPQKKKYNPTQQFGNLFNAYAKAFNKQYNRTGSLFESPFRRIPVNDERYFKQLIFYILNNPVHHGFCDDMTDYPWSSYLTTISDKPTKLQRNKVLGWFNSKPEFIEFHRQNHDDKSIESLIIE